MNETAYASATVTDIRREKAARKAAYIKRFGNGFMDVIVEAFNGHGRGKTGFSCEFRGGPQSQTHISGETLVEFTRRQFGTGGTLIKVRSCENGNFWAVIKN